MKHLTLSIVAILAILGATFASSSYGKISMYDAGIEAYMRKHYQVAMYEFEPRAMRGDPIAQFYVGRMYHLGRGVNQDKKMAEKWYKKAAEQHEPRAQYYLAILYLEWNKDLAMAKGWLKNALKNPRFSKELVPKDLAMVKGLLKNALKNPRFSKELVAEAQYQLGKIYVEFNGEKAQPDSAKYWYEKAAKQELAKARYRLGVMYHDGEGVEANRDSAKYWYEKAAADRMDGGRGHVEAQYNLSMLYFQEARKLFKAHADWEDAYKSAMDWCNMAANQGLAKAQYQYAVSYQWNEWDFKKAEHWFEKAAKQGFGDAQNDLAVMYDKCIKLDDFRMIQGKLSQEDQKYYEACEQLGDGIKKKAEKIARLYLEAAQQVGTITQFNLGTYFKNGFKNDEGEVLIKKNYKEAYYWYSLANFTKEDYFASQKKKKIMSEDRIEPEQDLKKQIDEGMKHTGEYLAEYEKKEIEDLVNSWKPKKLQGFGTGFYIDNEYILTNAHVVCSSYSSSTCVEYDELRIPFQRVDSIVAIDKEVDLALLRVDSNDVDSRANEYPVAKLRSTDIQLAETVSVFGYPLSNISLSSLSSLSYRGNFTEGIVSGLVGPINEPQTSNRFQFTAPIQGGNSGGPVFDNAGNVIGVVVTRDNPIIKAEYGKTGIEDRQNINFAINLNAIKEFLKEHNVTYEPADLDSTLTWEEIAKRAKMFTVPVLGFKDIPSFFRGDVR